VAPHCLPPWNGTRVSPFKEKEGMTHPFMPTLTESTRTGIGSCLHVIGFPMAYVLNYEDLQQNLAEFTF